jgi:hypothetical protein
VKVKIGPFIDIAVSNVYRDYMHEKYGYYDWDEPTTKYERFLEKLEDALQWVYNKTINIYLDNKKRKIKVHIDKYDTWNMDETLSYIIHPMLVQLKKTKHGAPVVDDEDVPDELKRINSTPVPDHETDENWFKRWDWVMDEMIFAFESATTDWESQFHSGEHDISFEKIEGTNLSRLTKGPKDTHEFDLEGYNKYQDRVQNGFRLFGKYYRGLWD